ncbi:DUF6114 domain-containing protein [Rhodococcoides kroppenstedtii]|uniref:DUF6114 domain-containing protein n=1 Tax=Rhodococcoides kroppenstedtii TaxID=293050 RepID=UPI0028EE26E5|nr:DUF6114 domain-containing protein [Rhodococcus kroppenstedtii]
MLTTWRHTRPWWGGLLLALSAAFLLLPAVSSFRVGDLLISFSTIGGVSTALFGSLMTVCAVAVLSRPSTRIPAGGRAMVLAPTALPAANLGGFVAGTVLGVVGSAACLAWQPATSPSPSAPPSRRTE